MHTGMRVIMCFMRMIVCMIVRMCMAVIVPVMRMRVTALPVIRTGFGMKRCRDGFNV